MTTDLIPQETMAVAPPAPLAGSPGPPASVRGAVELIEITRRYGDFVALDRVSLDITPGEFIAVLGPSGSGKTTLMRTVGGFVEPTHGRVLVSGIDMRAVPPYRRDVATVFQNYALFPHMTIEANVAYGLKMQRVKRDARRRRVAEMLEMVQLADSGHKRPGQLSGGQQQRVALARAIATSPAVLLLDEPLGALDRKLRSDMQLELRRIQRSLGMTFLYVTHDQEEALTMADRVVVMRGGRVEQIGTPETIYDAPATEWLAGFVGGSNRIAGRRRPADGPVSVDSDACAIVADHLHHVAPGVTDVVAMIRPEHIRILTGEEVPSTPNRVRLRVTEVCVLGSQTRVVGRTAGGLELTALLARGPAGPHSSTGPDSNTSPDSRTGSDIRAGSEVVAAWDPDAVHVYAAGGAGPTAPPAPPKGVTQ